MRARVNSFLTLGFLADALVIALTDTDFQILTARSGYGKIRALPLLPSRRA